MSEQPDMFIDDQCPECGCRSPECQNELIAEFIEDLTYDFDYDCYMLKKEDYKKWEARSK